MLQLHRQDYYIGASAGNFSDFDLFGLYICGFHRMIAARFFLPARLKVSMANIKIDTRFGELSVDPSQLITFPRGIPGFEKNTMWKLFHEIDEQGNWVSGVVVHLQSIDDGDVSLSLTDPTLFGFNYNLMLTDNEVAELKLEDPNDVLVLIGLSARDVAPQDGRKVIAANVYANISAPILINTKSRIGIQKTLNDSESKMNFRPVAAA